MATETVMVRLLDQAGAAFGAVSGAEATKAAGENPEHAVFVFANQPHVVALAKRAAKGPLVVVVTDAKRVKWGCSTPTITDETVTMAGVRQGGAT